MQFHNNGGTEIAQIAIEEGATNEGQIVFKTGGTTTAMTIDKDGHITKPLQPSFLVQFVGSSSNQSIGVNTDTTLSFDTERFDVNSDFASNVFTAPVTGKYFLGTTQIIGNPPTDASYFEVAIVTSNRRLGNLSDYDAFDSTVTYWSTYVGGIFDMDANDTAEVRCYQAGGSANAFIYRNSASMYFSGMLIG